MGVLIDASVLIHHERGNLDLESRAADSDEEAFLSVITVSELLHGVQRAKGGVRKANRSVFVESVLDRFQLLPIDLPTARIHAELRAVLSSAGEMIGAHDLWLAAAARAHGLILATANLREFSRVPGLEVEDWSREGWAEE